VTHQIDLSTFLTLTDQDLKHLGISTFGARRKMLTAIAGQWRSFHMFWLFIHLTLCLQSVVLCS